MNSPSFQTADLVLAGAFLSLVLSCGGEPAGHVEDGLEGRLKVALEAEPPDTGRVLDLAARLVAEQDELSEGDAMKAAHLHEIGLLLTEWWGSDQDVWQEAEELLAKALELRQKGGEEARFGTSETLVGLSVLAHRRGDWAEAEDYMRRALDIRLGIPDLDPKKVADSQSDLAFLFLQQARYSEAEPLLVQALESYREAEAQDGIAEVQQWMAELRRVRNQFRDAEHALIDARQRARRIVGEQDPTFLVDLENDLAALYVNQRQLWKAELIYRRLLSGERPPEVWDDQWASLALNLGETYRLQGDYAKADDLYARARAEAERVFPPDHPRLALYYNWSAAFYADQENYDLAESLYQEALKISGQTLPANHPQLALINRSLGSVYLAWDQPQRAADLYRDALGIWERQLGSERSEVAVTLTRLAQCLLDFDDEQAEGHLGQALEIFASTNAFPDVEAEAYALRAEILKRRGEAAEALADLDESLKRLESLRIWVGGSERRRAEFLARHSDGFHRMLEWQLEAGDLAGAVLTAERSRARALTDQLSKSRFDLSRTVPDLLRQNVEAARAREGDLARRIEFLETEMTRHDLADDQRAELRGELEKRQRALDRARGELDDLEKEIRSSSRLVHADRTPASLRTIQAQVVPMKGLILLYQLGSPGSYLFVIPPAPQKAEVFPLEIQAADAVLLGAEPGPVNAETLAGILLRDGPPGSRGLVRNLEAAPSDRGLDEEGNVKWLQGLHALWRVLVPEQIRTRVLEARSVIVIPDGPLYRLPFEALVVEPAESLHTARWWLDKGPAVSYGASATTLIGQTIAFDPPPAAGAWIVSVADPLITDSQRQRAQHSRNPLARLVAARGEVDSIRRAFADRPSGDIVTLEKAEATESAVRAAVVGARYLHFATHSLVVERPRDLEALLLLTPVAEDESADDGYLELSEVYDLELDCELAVLSACSTHVGFRVPGEGVFALSRAFLVSGAKRVVASLWSVEDFSTAKLTGHLFSAIASAEKSAREPRYAGALRRAKCFVRNEVRWQDPHYWAPFLLVGESPPDPAPLESCSDLRPPVGPSRARDN